MERRAQGLPLWPSRDPPPPKRKESTCVFFAAVSLHTHTHARRPNRYKSSVGFLWVGLSSSFELYILFCPACVVFSHSDRIKRADPAGRELRDTLTPFLVIFIPSFSRILSDYSRSIGDRLVNKALTRLGSGPRWQQKRIKYAIIRPLKYI